MGQPSCALDLPSSPVSPLASRALSVLVVDDDRDTAELLATLLQRQGYNATFTCSATSCVSILDSMPVDLVVTDVCMPEVGGLELCAFVKASFPSTAVVVLTGLGGADIVYRARSCGASAVLLKPIRVAPLAAALERVVRDRDRLR